MGKALDDVVGIVDCNWAAEPNSATELLRMWRAAWRLPPLPPEAILRCECGARKTGVADMAPGHSTWCPVAPEGGR